jgi:hypothetical protein
MANWLAALGSAALSGSQLMRQRRLEEEEMRRRDQSHKLELARQALLENDALRSERLFKRNMAKDVLDMAGPNGMVTPEAAATVREGGLDFRLQNQEAMLPSKQFEVGLDGAPSQIEVAGQEAGISVIPTATQASELEERAAVARQRSMQERARGFVASDNFLQQPIEKRQQVWTMAGYPGQVPETWDERKKVLDYEAGQRMKELGVMYPPNRFNGGSGSGGSGGAGNAYADERAQRTVDMIDEMLGDGTSQNPGLIGWTSAGPMGVFGSVPLGPQHTLHNKLQALGANIAFTELQEMRNASRTGGALGNVSNEELKLLQNAMGAIQQTNDPRVLRAELAKIKGSLERWENAKIVHGMSQPGTSNGSAPPPGSKFTLVPIGQ